MNLYNVLGVSSEASSAEIKAAFRKRIKELHPDLQAAGQKPTRDPDQSEVTIHQLIEAYELLMDQAQREAYDRARHTAPRESEFNYREWLKQRPDELSRAKLIFYDVLRERSADAVSLYLSMTQERALQLEKLLGREDFMDCAFMLAMEFESQEDDLQAIQLYIHISRLELERPFFRHFFAEVEERLVRLLTQKPMLPLDAPSLVRMLEDLQRYPFHPTAKGSFLIRQAEVYYQSGQRLMAFQSLERARAYSPRDKLISKLEKSWR
ncbi:MAG: J domain-containing protein [Spirochaetales bacterium]